jgi:two-component system, NtrC family, sensor kinase
MVTTQDETIAELERANVELRQERDAALTERNSAVEYQAATSDVLKMMSSSATDTVPVFDIILRHAMHLCNCKFGGLQEFDGELVHLRATRGFAPDALAVYAREFPKVPTGADFANRAILTGQTVHIRDVDTEPGRLKSTQALAHKSNLAVPLLRKGAAIGAISLGHADVDGFTDAHVELLKTFAEQAVIAIGTTATFRALQDRTTDLRESLEYQIATSDVLKVISRSTFDLEPVFQTVAATAVRLCNAHQAGIYLRQNGEYRWASGYSQLPEYERIEREASIRPETGTLVGRVVLEGRPVQILDAWTDTLYEAKEDARVGAVHTLLGVPLLRDGSPIGVIGLGRQKIEPFTERQVALVSTFADQAVIAMENARLLSELQTRTADLQESLEYQTATSDVLKVISRSTFDLQPVLDTLVETAARLCDADMAAIGRPVGSLWRLAANYGFPAEFEEQQRTRGAYPLDPDSPTVAARAVRERRTVHIRDAAAVSGYPEVFIGPGKQRTSLGVPLLREGEAIGYIALARQRVEPFTEPQIELVSTFADQAVIAIENTRLITEQREALEQQTATAEVLQVINASPGNLAPVFDAVLEKGLRLCGAAFGTL